MGSGYAIGIQGKGTAVIHRADRLPHMNIELFSNAPVTSLEYYRAMGRNAALYALGRTPEPIIVPVDGQDWRTPSRTRRHALCDRDRASHSRCTAARPRHDHRPRRPHAMTDPLDLYPISEKAPDAAVSASVCRSIA